MGLLRDWVPEYNNAISTGCSCIHDLGERSKTYGNTRALARKPHVRSNDISTL
jgi:hypothetical protein